MRGGVTAAAAGLILACTSPAPAPPVPAHVDLGLPPTFSVNGAQARQVAILVNLVAAYDDGRVEDALALVDERVGVSDCDYRRASVVTFSDRLGAERWLRQRVYDHDRLRVQSIWNLNPGDPVVGVVWALRSSDSLKSLGFPNGIRPQLSAKVIFDRATDRVRGFAYGPFGGDQRSCRPIATYPFAALTPPLPGAGGGSRHPAPGPFVISARNAINVATLVSFVRAFNSGRVEVALSLLTDGVAVSDCDHATGQVVSFKGRDEAARWLGRQLATHDQLDIVRVYNASVQADVMGIAFGSRPNSFAKVIFSGGQIAALGLAGSGGSC